MRNIFSKTLRVARFLMAAAVMMVMGWLAWGLLCFIATPIGFLMVSVMVVIGGIVLPSIMERSWAARQENRKYINTFREDYAHEYERIQYVLLPTLAEEVVSCNDHLQHYPRGLVLEGCPELAIHRAVESMDKFHILHARFIRARDVVRDALIEGGYSVAEIEPLLLSAWETVGMHTDSDEFITVTPEVYEKLLSKLPPTIEWGWREFEVVDGEGVCYS